MKIRSSNLGQKQIVDTKTDHSDGWCKVKPKKPNTNYILNGRKYKVIDKYERHLPFCSLERICHVTLGILISICTFFIAPCFSKFTRQLFTGRQVRRVVERVLLYQSPKAQVLYSTVQSRTVIYQNSPKYAKSPTPFKKISNPGGSANIVNLIMKGNPQAKCGVMICANSGLPCGKIALDGFADQHSLNYTTQEESIIANLLLTQFGDDTKKHEEFMFSSFQGVWGLIDEKSTMTFQGVDFTKATDPSAYNQAYILDNCQLGVTKGKATQKTLLPGVKNNVTLVFADSINANTKIGGATGTMQRTLNRRGATDYQFFCECIKTKLRASLDAMVKSGVSHAIIGRISCGIYAPDSWKKGNTNIIQDFYQILTDVLQEQVGPNGESRRAYFMEVIVPA